MGPLSVFLCTGSLNHKLVHCMQLVATFCCICWMWPGRLVRTLYCYSNLCLCHTDTAHRSNSLQPVAVVQWNSLGHQLFWRFINASSSSAASLVYNVNHSTVALLKHSFVFVNAPVNASEIDFQFSSWAGTIHLVWAKWPLYFEVIGRGLASLDSLLVLANDA